MTIKLHDDNRLGSGTRTYAVLKVGYKHVRLLALGNLRSVTVSRRRYGLAEPVTYNPTKLAQQIDRVMGYYTLAEAQEARALALRGELLEA